MANRLTSGFASPCLEEQRVDDEGLWLCEVLVQFGGKAAKLVSGEKSAADDPVTEEVDECQKPLLVGIAGAPNTDMRVKGIVGQTSIA